MNPTNPNHPLARLRYHVTGAIERGEAQAIIEQPATPRPALNWVKTASVCRPGKFFYSAYPWTVTNDWITGKWHGSHPARGETITCDTAKQAMSICERHASVRE